MRYENAPATKMLATNCACCRKELLDAKSVEIGMGPVCRRKHGYDIDVSEDVRIAANKIVYEIAVEQSRNNPDRSMIIARAVALRLQGFNKLADVILDRTCEVRIAEQGDRLVVKAPYSAEATLGWRGIPGRRWDGDAKANTVPVGSRPALWAFLKRFYGGCGGVGPQGAFQIPEAA